MMGFGSRLRCGLDGGALLKKKFCFSEAGMLPILPYRINSDAVPEADGAAAYEN
jgi:hypothetical protein